MSTSTMDPENMKAIQLTRQAQVAEFRGQYQHAYDIYAEVSRLLVKVVERGQKSSDERRRAKMQRLAINGRKVALEGYLQGTSTPPAPLPSGFTADREVTHPTAGIVLLTAVETGRRTSLAEGTSFAHTHPHSRGSSSPHFLTPLLSPSLPIVTYHIYAEQTQHTTGKWIYFHVKNAEKTQVLYTLETFVRQHHQIRKSTLSRATEYHNPCAKISISSVKPRQYETETRSVGRAFKIHLETHTVVLEEPDRLEKDWNPRRFTYGGRRFVWKMPKGLTNTVSSLYETRAEWPDPSSKTGKILDEVHSRPLVWGEAKFAKDKVCTIHMAGGLDQVFRELLLASEMTKQMIQIHG